MTAKEIIKEFLKIRDLKKEETKKYGGALGYTKQLEGKLCSNAKKYLKNTDKYSEIVWHSYSAEKPKKDGFYLVTHRFGNKIEVTMAYVTKDMNSDNLIAWAELPEPYEGKKR